MGIAGIAKPSAGSGPAAVVADQAEADQSEEIPFVEAMASSKTDVVYFQKLVSVVARS